MTFGESKADCSVTATNVSDKTITKMSFVLDAVEPNGHDIEIKIGHDHTNHPLAAGDNTNDLGCSFAYNDDDRPSKPTKPTANLRVTAITFADGDTWDDSAERAKRDAARKAKAK